MPQIKMPVPVLVILTVAPAILIGATLWMAGNLVPACEITETSRLPAPDGQFDLVIFSRDCGDTPPNAQAALVPPGEEVPFDAAAFVSVVGATELASAWTAEGAIDITLPADAEVFRQDEAVAGVPVTYR